MKNLSSRRPYLSTRRPYQRYRMHLTSAAMFRKTREKQVAQKYGVYAPFPRNEVAELWTKRQAALKEYRRARFHIEKARTPFTVARWTKALQTATRILEACTPPPPYVSWNHIRSFIDGSPMPPV